jgi:starvation-inducible DNA-binding protein
MEVNTMSQPMRVSPDSREVLALQETYVDLLYMTIQTEHVRWTLRSSGFSLLMILLEGLTSEWRRWSEDVAQQLIVLGVAPDGRVETIAAHYHNPVREGWRDPNNVQQRILEELGMRATWCQGRSGELTADAAQSAALLTEIADGITAQTEALRTCHPN